MRVVVTGCAGFVGSALTRALLDRGDSVFGVDSFTPYYDQMLKHQNLATFAAHPGFSFRRLDLGVEELDREEIAASDVVFHLAGQPGVRASWREGFGDYVRHNVHATQRVLEAAVAANPGVRIVYASSSSVYGNEQVFPVSEDCRPSPHSPYGVTKLAGEHLCRLYAKNFGLSTVSLRYFTVYGPGQRPDMAFHRLIEAGLSGQAFPLFGDGSQVRDFTYVDDIVAGTLAAAVADVTPGLVANLAGGSSVSIREVIDIIGELVGRDLRIERRDAQPGDPVRTGGTIEVANSSLGWSPRVGLRDGIRSQVASLRVARSCRSEAPLRETA